MSRLIPCAALGGLLAAGLAACGSGAPGGGEAESASARRAADNVGQASAAPPTSGQIQREIAAAEGTPPPGPAEAWVSARRCGWLSNPTPGNWWLFDGHGEWILAVQGGYQASGLDDMPDMSTAGWEETNGHYGHGCACMTLTVDPASGRVMRIADAKPKPLRQCHADRGLPRP